MHPSVNIHHIGDGFKSIERDSYGKNKLGPLDMAVTKNWQQLIYILNEEIWILEIEEQSKVNWNRQSKHQPSMQLFLSHWHPLDKVEIKERGTQNYKNEPGGTPTIKENAENQDYQILILLVNQIIGDQEYR